MLLDNETLRYNSRILVGLVKAILSNFKHVEIEKKFTTTAGKRSTLAGITIDWRHVEDWNSFKQETEPLLKKAIRNELKLSSNTPSPLYIQTYNTHPFIDVYSAKSDKGVAFDYVTCEILNIKGNTRIFLSLTMVLG